LGLSQWYEMDVRGGTTKQYADFYEIALLSFAMTRLKSAFETGSDYVSGIAKFKSELLF